jgi:uncharacterized protein YndB with AHSA1/START domain
MNDQIERECAIAAPIDRVWSAVTEPRELASWFCDSADLDVTPGARGTLTWKPNGSRGEAVIQVRVEALEPMRLFRFRWAFPADEEPTESNSRLVEFTLTGEGSGTRLGLVDSGFYESDDSVDGFSEGWDEHIVNLTRYAEAAA